MSKITKKQLHNGWHCHDTEIIKMKKELRELKQSVLRLEKLTDEKLLDEPQLKQLDQSVFNGLDEKWRFAAVDSDGAAFAFVSEPARHGAFWGNSNQSQFTRRSGKGAYDASNWQNSLIERDIAKELLEVDLSSELTGDLCQEMYENGARLIMCAVSNLHKPQGVVTKQHDIDVIHDLGSFTSSTHPYIGFNNNYKYATPINNQGEPLTASEVGL